MKSNKDLMAALKCKYYQVKIIAEHQKWNRIIKRGYVFYDITDEHVNEYIANPVAFNNHDYSLDLYKLTLEWSNLNERYLRHC